MKLKNLLNCISSGDFKYKLRNYVNGIKNEKELIDIFNLSIKYYNIELYQYLKKYNFIIYENKFYCRDIPTIKVKQAFYFYFNILDYSNAYDIDGNKVDRDYMLNQIKRKFLFHCVEHRKIKKFLLVKEYFDLFKFYQVLKKRYLYMSFNTDDLNELYKEIRLEKIRLLKN